MGDLRYFLKILQNPNKKPFIKNFNILSFKDDELHCFSKMTKDKLTVTNSELIINNNVKYNFKDIVSIEMIDTVVVESNKGLVIKIVFSDEFIFCFSLGSYHFLPGQFSTIARTNEIFDLLNEKWQNHNKLNENT
jgi:hypothetical protein